MKQHITWHQLEELSNKGKKRLLKWWEDYYAGEVIEGAKDVFCEEEYCEGHPAQYDHYSSLLDIGQMIEFLEDSLKGWDLHQYDNGGWAIGMWDDGDFVEKNMMGELCDTLWQAVKEVLEKP